MFSNPVTPDSKFDEGTVQQVDAERKVCKVVTLRGQKLDNVQWLAPYGGNDRQGDRFTPRMGDRVLVAMTLGYPVIMGTIARPQSGLQSFPITLDSGEANPDTGNYAPGTPRVKGDASKPSDSVLGDRVISSQGGGMLAMLRAGSVVLRASRAAEIFMGRFGDLVRIVSRNFEHFTDLSTDTYRNFRGRVYRYFGVSSNARNAILGDYTYHQYFGDTSAAEAVKAGHEGFTGSLPAVSGTVFKEQITASGAEMMRRSVNLDGSEEVFITDGSTFTRRLSNGQALTLSFGDKNTVTIDGAKIKLHHDSGADVQLDANGIVSVFQDGQVEMKSNHVKLTFSGATVELKADGVFTRFDSHFVNVTAAGVQVG